MAYTFWGIGTRFYGRAEFRADGSHLMTEFVTIFYCPVIPVRSVRAIITGRRTTGVPLLFWSTRTNYSVLEIRRPNLYQCLRVYALALGVVCSAVLLNLLVPSSPFLGWLIVTGLAGVAITVFLRNRARRAGRRPEIQQTHKDAAPDPGTTAD